MTTRIKPILAQLWIPILLLALWYFASRNSTNFYFPPLEKIWAALMIEVESGDLWRNMFASLRNISVGLLFGVAVGVVVGVAIGQSRSLRAILHPYLQFARSVPQVALVPIIIGVLGIQAGPKIWAIAFACVWPVLLNTVDGIRAIDPGVRDMVKAYRIPLRLNLMKVILPASMPQIAAGIRVSLSVAVVVMVVSEVYGAVEGIGYFINQSGSTFNIAATWAGTLVVGFLGYLLSMLFLLFEKTTLRWYLDSAQ